MFNSQEARVGMTIGLPIGLVLAYLMFNNIGWYHNYITWQFQHPLVLLPCAVIGGLVGYFAD